MESKKSKKFPKSALAFYIKLYCKQKGSSNTKYQSILMEATKSWLSLSEEEKLQLNTVYKESEREFKLQLLEKLKNAEPFMKMKDVPRSQNVDLNSLNIIMKATEAHTEDVGIQTEVQSNKQTENYEDINLGFDEELSPDIGVKHSQQENNETLMEPMDINEQAPRIFLVEPLPPTLKNSKDLFKMLNSTDGENSMSWTTLPATEKNQYRRAVSLLKKDYITKYREYLESLTPKELFDHYNKTLF